MLVSPHLECKRIWHMILMWNDQERDHVRMLCPNGVWKDLSLHDPSLWTHGEAGREWQRVTRNLQSYRDHTVLELCVLHSPCGLMERQRKLQIERSSSYA